MTSPEKFLGDFARDLREHQGDQQSFIAGYAAHLRARDRSNRFAGMRHFKSKLNIFVRFARAIDDAYKMAYRELMND